jgi:predicted lipoprotein with Yx(FWY)xxD motif
MVFTMAAILVAQVAFADMLTIKAKDGLGNYLADEKGVTLYMFKKDQPGKSVCGAANGCLEKWPVFYADKIETVAEIDGSQIGVITRDDGKKQTTYKGMPLYYFFKDKGAGDTFGQGVNNIWYVVAP